MVVIGLIGIGNIGKPLLSKLVLAGTHKIRLLTRNSKKYQNLPNVSTTIGSCDSEISLRALMMPPTDGVEDGVEGYVVEEKIDVLFVCLPQAFSPQKMIDVGEC